MRMLVLGAGLQGGACAYDLLSRSDHDVVLADVKFADVPAYIAPYVGGRLTLQELDANDDDSLRAVLDGASAVMSALPYYLNGRIAERAIEAGAHFCDLGGNTAIVKQQKQLHDRAVERGVSLIPDCGLAPGMVNILAAEGIRRLDTAREVYLMVGGLPQEPEPPLNYQVVYSLEGVIDYYTNESWILRDGELSRVEALSEVEAVTVPAIGTLEAFHTAGGLSLMAQQFEGKIDRMEYKTLRYPGHAEIMRSIRELGLFSTDPVDVHGERVTPRDLFLAVAEPQLRRDPQESPDMVVLRVLVRGEKDGAETEICWDLVDRFDPETGITAMMRTTGFSLAITGLMQAEGKIPAGTWTPDEVIDASLYIAALAERGIDIEVSTGR